MAYDEKLADRAREIIALTHKNVEEKKMFGGMCFMVNGKMCAGVIKNRLMVRINPELNEEALLKDGCIAMDFTGKEMEGFLFIEPEVLDTVKQFQYWIGLALEYNKTAKASRKK